jgi:histone deacetylase complex regulatory component SIN3
MRSNTLVRCLGRFSRCISLPWLQNMILTLCRQVKQQVGHKPEIYNRFLDIMKDFKVHSIETQVRSLSRLLVSNDQFLLYKLNFYIYISQSRSFQQLHTPAA